MFEIPLAVCLIVLYAALPVKRMETLMVVLIFYILLPVVFFAFRMRAGRIADWDLTNKKERNSIYLFTIASHLWGVLLLALLGQVFLMKIFLVLLAVSAVFMVVNLYWKISVHAGVNALLMVLLNSFYGWKIFGWLMVVLLLVLWSRVYLKKHTITQVMIGAVVAFVLVDLGLRIAGG